MCKRTLGRWATRLAGAVLLVTSVTLMVSTFVYTTSDFEWF
jgi:hypothetical protein